jgi:hypothetical protein
MRARLKKAVRAKPITPTGDQGRLYLKPLSKGMPKVMPVSAGFGPGGAGSPKQQPRTPNFHDGKAQWPNRTHAKLARVSSLYGNQLEQGGREEGDVKPSLHGEMEASKKGSRRRKRQRARLPLRGTYNWGNEGAGGKSKA